MGWNKNDLLRVEKSFCFGKATWSKLTASKLNLVRMSTKLFTLMLAKKGMEDISFKNSAKPLLENEISTSSTYRELLAVKYILQAFDQILKSQYVQSY